MLNTVNHTSKFNLKESQKKLIAELIMRFKREKNFKDEQKKYYTVKIDKNILKISYKNLSKKTDYKLFFKNIDDKYTYLLNKKSDENGFLRDININIPKAFLGESFEIVLLNCLEKMSQVIIYSFYPNPLINQKNGKTIILDMILKKGLLYGCYGNGFEKNSNISVLSFSSDELITKKYKVNSDGNFMFLISPFSKDKNEKYQSKLIIKTKNDEFELNYNFGISSIKK